MFQPNLGRWMQMDPIGFAAGDQNLYRAEENSPTTTVDYLGLDGIKIKSANGKYSFDLTGATRVPIAQDEFKVGQINGKIVIFKGGSVDVRTAANALRNQPLPPLPSTFAFVALTDCDEADLNWLQFVKRSVEVYPGKTKPKSVPIHKPEGTAWHKLADDKSDNWTVDSATWKSALYGGDDRSPFIRNGLTDDVPPYRFATAMYDEPEPSGRINPAYKKEVFEARTYLVAQGDIVYSIIWTVTWERDVSGKWKPKDAQIVKAQPGEVDFPVDKSKATWPWYNNDKGVPNPLKR